jgi:hypothetical protein
MNYTNAKFAVSRHVAKLMIGDVKRGRKLRRCQDESAE